MSPVPPSEKGKAVEGKAVLVERSVFDLKANGADTIIRVHDLIGHKVDFRLVSATVGDPRYGNRGVLGPAAYLEKRLQPDIHGEITGEREYGVTFEVVDSHGIPGAIIVRNRHLAEFFLRHITIENFPGKGRIHFECNSWVYNSEKYSCERIFFTNEPYLPKKTPDPLRAYREDELRNLRGDEVSRKLEEWDRVYGYAFYDDLGNPDKSSSLARPVLGGSAALPYPRRGKTARPPTKTDPHAESPSSPHSENYVPHDERFKNVKALDFLGHTIKTVAKDLLPMLQDALNMTAGEFESFKEVLELYERGLPLPDIPVVRKFLEAAPCEKFQSILLSVTGQVTETEFPEDTHFQMFRNMLPMLKVILNMSPIEFDAFKEALILCEAGLPLPDIPLVRRFLEIAPGEMFKALLVHIAEQDALFQPSEAEPFKKLNDLAPLLQVILHFTPDELHSFKDALGRYKDGQPLPDIPLVRRFIEAAPREMFKDILMRGNEKDGFFKHPDDAPFEKHFKSLLPMLQVIISFAPDELDLFKKVMDNFGSGLSLPDIPLIKKFLEAAPCKKFRVVHIPNIGHENLFKFPAAMPWEKFRDLMPTLQVVVSFTPDECNTFMEFLAAFKGGLPPPLPIHTLLLKLLEVPPCDKFRGVIFPVIEKADLFALPLAAPFAAIFRGLVPILQTIMNLAPDEFASLKDALDHYEGGFSLRDNPLVQKILMIANWDKSKAVLVPADYHQSIFRFPEVAPLEKHFNGLLPMLHAVMNLKPIELDPFKNVLHHFERGLPLPDIPLIQKFINKAPCEKFECVLVPRFDQESSFKTPKIPPLEKLKDMYPMLIVIIEFQPSELDSFKKALDLYRSGSPLADIPPIRKFLELAPGKMFAGILKDNADKENLFSLDKTTHLERYFNDILPMIQIILNMTADELHKFKEVLDHQKKGIPLPNIPQVQNFIEAAPCEKFKPVLTPAVTHNSLFQSPEAVPLENHFKEHLPMLLFIMKMAPNELDSFRKLLIYYEVGFPLPDIPLIRKLLGFVPNQKFKEILELKVDPGDLLKLPDSNPLEMFRDLLPMLRVILNFAATELVSFKKASDDCAGGLPLPDIPQIRILLEAAPYAKFKSIISGMATGSLFKSPEALHLENYFKNLLPMIQVIVNLAPNELDTFKDAMFSYELGLPLPDIPLIRKFLEVAPCEKFKVVLMPDVNQDGLSGFPKEKFKALVPMMLNVINFNPDELDKFKKVLKICEDGSPLQDIPLVREFLKAAPGRKFKDSFIDGAAQGSLFSSPEGVLMEKYFRDLLPMLLMITNLEPKDFNLFKEVLGHFEGGIPLPDNPVIRRFFEVAPCEKFKPVLMPSAADMNNLFMLPNAAPLEKFFKELLPMFQSIMHLVPDEFNLFKEVVSQYEYGLPLPAIAPVRAFLEVVPDEKFKTILKPDEGHQSVRNLAEGAPLEKLRDILPMLHVIINFGLDELASFKIMLDQYQKGLPLQDTPLVRKFLEVAPYENLKAILKHDVEQGSLFKLPEAAPLEKFFKDLMPMLHVILNMIPNEFESFKNVLHRYELGLTLPSIPLVQTFLDAAPSEEFKVVLMPKVSLAGGSKVAGSTYKFRDMVPMLEVIVNFKPNEMNSFKEVLDLCIRGSPPPDIPIIRKLLQFSPLEKIKDILEHNVKEGSLFSLPEAAPLENYFKGLVPMLQIIVNFKHDELDSFREALVRHRDGLPLPNVPLVQNILNVSPGEKFKPILIPHDDHDSLFGFLEAAPSEKYFKSLLPQLQVIITQKPVELDLFKRILYYYEAGLPLLNIPLVRKFLEAAPHENFKALFPPSNLPLLPVDAPTEKFQHLFPMLQVITRFTPDEFISFKEVLDQCHGGSPLKDIPLVRRFLEAAPYAKFRTILTSSIGPSNLFELPEAVPLVKYFKHLLPMLLMIVSLTPIDFSSFKEVLDRYEVEMSLPDIPLISKFLEVAPCEKFKPILIPHFSHDLPLLKFKDLLPILLVLINLTANKLSSFKEELDRSKGEPPLLPDIPLVRKLLKVMPSLGKHFKDLLPMFLVIVNLAPNEFDTFKEAFKHYKDRLPLPDLPLIRKVLEAAPCEKFRAVIMPGIDQDSLFRLPETGHLEKLFRDMLPMFHTILNFKQDEFNSFRELLHNYNYGLPMPDVPIIRKFLEAAPNEKFKVVLAPNVARRASAGSHYTERPRKPADHTIKIERINHFTEVITPSVERSSLFKLPEVPPFDKFKGDAQSIGTCGLLKLPMPKIIQEDKWVWATDEEFARQMLAGVNPVVIQRLTEFPPKSKLDPKEFGNQNSTIKPEIIQPNLDGLSVKQALDRNKLYILDHHDTVMPYLGRINATGHKVYATRTVLFLKKDGTLKPVAIELSLPTQKGSVSSQVYTPSSSGVAGAIWFLAKTHVIVNDSSIHQLISHWLHTHAAVEPFVIATNRQLSVMHPINKLLVPHFRHTMSINAVYRQVLINAGGILELTSFPGKYAMEMSAAAYKGWNLVEQGLPADLIKRGMAVKDKSCPHNLRLFIQDYPYAADGLEVWSAIESWVRDYCAIYYDCNDETVLEDDELQCWWKEIREVGHGDLKDQPWWPKMSCFADLVQSCTTIIWIASGMHAAVNFGQYHYAGHIPNRPTISRRFIPEPGSPDYELMKNNPESLFLRTINGMLQTIIGVSVMEIQSTHAGDEVYLGQRECAEWTGDQRAVECLKRFGVKLKALETKIAGMNRDPLLKNRTGQAKMAYTLLSPYSKSGITGKGIPNSISI